MNPGLYRAKRIEGVSTNAATLLLHLADAHPEKPEYGVALMELMLKKLRHPGSFRERQRHELTEAIHLAERLLGRWPNDPHIVSTVVRLHTRYIGYLRHMGENMQARKETDRLLNILEVLFYNPEISDAVRESLLELQFQRLMLFLRDRRGSNAGEQLREKIRLELQFYHGSRLREFREKLESCEKEAVNL